MVFDIGLCKLVYGSILYGTTGYIKCRRGILVGSGCVSDCTCVEPFSGVVICKELYPLSSWIRFFAHGLL